MNYRVKVENVDINPEFGADKDLQEGIECEGFMLIAFRDLENTAEKLDVASAIYRLSVRHIVDFLKYNKAEVGSDILQAASIAEGYLQAKRIYEEWKKRQMMERLFGNGKEE